MQILVRYLVMFAWGNVLACAKTIAKMRRQGQRPSYFSLFFYLLLDPEAFRNFACVFV